MSISSSTSCGCGCWAHSVFSQLSSQLNMPFSCSPVHSQHGLRHSKKVNKDESVDILAPMQSTSNCCPIIPVPRTSQQKKRKKERISQRAIPVSKSSEVREIRREASETTSGMCYSGDRLTATLPHAQSSTFRMPDFFKRVFAPPNCMVPEIDDVENEPWSFDDLSARDRLLAKELVSQLSKDKKQALAYERVHSTTSQAVRDLQSATDECLACKDCSNPGLHVCPERVDTEFPHVSQFTSDNTCLAQGRGYPGRTLTCSATSSVYSATSAANASSSSPATRARKSMTNWVSESMRSIQATERAHAREAQVNEDIEAFLKTPIRYDPLNAQEITTLCETAEAIACSNKQPRSRERITRLSSRPQGDIPSGTSEEAVRQERGPLTTR